MNYLNLMSRRQRLNLIKSNTLIKKILVISLVAMYVEACFGVDKVISLQHYQIISNLN